VFQNIFWDWKTSFHSYVCKTKVFIWSVDFLVISKSSVLFIVPFLLLFLHFSAHFSIVWFCFFEYHRKAYIYKNRSIKRKLVFHMYVSMWVYLSMFACSRLWLLPFRFVLLRCGCMCGLYIRTYIHICI